MALKHLDFSNSLFKSGLPVWTQKFQIKIVAVYIGSKSKDVRSGF